MTGQNRLRPKRYPLTKTRVNRCSAGGLLDPGQHINLFKKRHKFALILQRVSFFENFASYSIKYNTCSYRIPWHSAQWD